MKRDDFVGALEYLNEAGDRVREVVARLASEKEITEEQAAAIALTGLADIFFPEHHQGRPVIIRIRNVEGKYHFRGKDLSDSELVFLDEDGKEVENIGTGHYLVITNGDVRK